MKITIPAQLIREALGDGHVLVASNPEPLVTKPGTIWYAIPSCRPHAAARKCLDAWMEMGYKIAILRQYERNAGTHLEDCAIYLETDRYLGFSKSVNLLVKSILHHDPSAQWIVTGGDDVYPDLHHTARQIGEQCSAHFGRCGVETFGIMQPTGDRWDNGNIDTAAASPWMGREFCRRMYGGNGPYCEEYHHLYADTELQWVAKRLGVFWQRPDLTHLHHHWKRGANPVMPEFSKPLYSTAAWWDADSLFSRREALNFPGHEPIL